MKKVNFTPKTDIEEYLNDDFNIEIFEDLTENEDWKGAFDPLEFLNLLYEQVEIVNANKEKPLSVVKHLLGLKLKQKKLYYLLYYLNRHIDRYLDNDYEPLDKQLNICNDFIEKELDKLEAELYPKSEPEPMSVKENKYDFQKVKQHIETLTNVKDKISYLTEIKTDYLQNRSSWDFLGFETPFEKQCELEIKKLKDNLKLEAETTTSKATPIFKLSGKRGAKMDLIRVLNALYELRLFEKTDGQIPSKLEFFETMGEYLGVDLSKYHTSLSQALQNQRLEVNLKVFEDMKEVTKNAHYQTKTK